MGVIRIDGPLAVTRSPEAMHAGTPGAASGMVSAAHDLERMHHEITRHRMPRDARLVVEGDDCGYLYVLTKGWVLKYKSSVDGRRQIVDFALPGDVLGFIESRPAPYAIDMLTDGEVVAIPRMLFDGAVASRADFAGQVCRQLEEAEIRAYDRIASIGYRSALRRVCQLLLELAGRLDAGRPDASAHHWALPLRQQHFGDALGLRVETVCRALVELRRRGIAILRRGRLHVLDMDGLIAESQATADPADAPPVLSATFDATSRRHRDADRRVAPETEEAASLSR